MSYPTPSCIRPPHVTWSSLAPYLVPPAAAAVAIVPAFNGLVAKSALQKGLPVPSVTPFNKLKAGFSAAPTVGMIVGAQIVLQGAIEKAFVGKGNQKDLTSMLVSSAAVGALSAPLLAIFNGQTMGWTIRESLRKFTPKQAFAITLQETSFVAGISAADRLANPVKQWLGENKDLEKGVEYAVAFTAGAIGSLVGHPANTALTRWQSGLTVDTFRQTMWGSARKARAIGLFSIAYKFVKESATPAVSEIKN